MQQERFGFYTATPSFMLPLKPLQQSTMLHANLLFIYLVFIVTLELLGFFLSCLFFIFKVERQRNVPLIFQTYRQRPVTMT